MATAKKNEQANDIDKGHFKDTSTDDDAVELDGTPVLDEKDLEENSLTVEEAEDIEWEDQDELEEAALEEADEDEDEDEEDE